jgi:hypothetical protein
MLRALTLNRLNEIATEIIIAEFPYFEELREMYKLFYYFGIRTNESFQINRWSFISGNSFSLQPQKGNNLRILTLDDNFTDFKAAIIGQYKPFKGRTVSQALHLFDTIRTFLRIYSNEKEITLYLFRYRFVRRMYQEGYTIGQIASAMGYVSTANIAIYLNAELWEECYEPWAAPDYLIDWDGYRPTDSNNDIIISP